MEDFLFLRINSPCAENVQTGDFKMSLTNDPQQIFTKVELKKAMLTHVLDKLTAYQTDIVYDFEIVNTIDEAFIYATRKTGTSIYPVSSFHFDHMNNLGNDEFWLIKKMDNGDFQMKYITFDEAKKIMRND